MYSCNSEMVDFLGQPWTFTYIQGALGHIDPEDKDRFEYEVTKLYYEQGEKRTFKGETCEG